MSAAKADDIEPSTIAVPKDTAQTTFLKLTLFISFFTPIFFICSYRFYYGKPILNDHWIIIRFLFDFN
jgi:hypothetical protein